MNDPRPRGQFILEVATINSLILKTHKMDKSMQRQENEKKQKEALDKYLSQFNSINEIITEVHHLNTYQYHLNIRLWHLHQGDAENAPEEEDHSAKNQEVDENISPLVAE